MGDLLAEGSAWLKTQRRAHMTREVVYARGAASVSVQATVGKTLFHVDDGYRVFQEIESRDYLINAADLILDAATVLPERGDQITETVDGVAYTYEVMAPAGEPHYRWSGREHATLRIHTKNVAVTP